MWKPLIAKLPRSANYVVIDLLGHGNSKISPARVYSADFQARNVLTTCLGLGYVGPYVFIGHSFGSIVAVECARRYPRTTQLILCALPLYNKPKQPRNPSEPESILFDIYERALKRPRETMAIYNIVGKMRLAGSSRTRLDEDSFFAFTETVRSGIINQQTAKHIEKLRLPITIIYGKLDPVVIGKNIEHLAKTQSNITAAPILSDHALRPPMISAILNSIIKVRQPQK
jgi:pimeloyl-ACP methyl ester carboxylesterase